MDIRRGDGGGWIFVGKYERYEWSRTRSRTEQSWSLVRASYSHSKSSAAGRRSRTLSDSRTVRESIDDTWSPERRLNAKIKITPPSPPMIVVTPRIPDGAEEMEVVNKEEVLDVLVQGLWIVWREGIVEDTDPAKRNSWTPIVKDNKRKKTFWDRILCRN